VNLLQAGFDQAVKDAVVKRTVELITAKAKEQGATVTKRQQSKLHKYFSGSMEGAPPELLFPDSDQEVVIDLSTLGIDKVIAAVLGKLPSLLRESTEETATRLAIRYKERWPEESERQRLELGHFELNLQARWGRPLGLLAMVVTLSREFGGTHLNEIIGAKDSRPNLVGSVVRLHARACQVATEVITLLRAGLADGVTSPHF